MKDLVILKNVSLETQEESDTLISKKIIEECLETVE